MKRLISLLTVIVLLAVGNTTLAENIKLKYTAILHKITKSPEELNSSEYYLKVFSVLLYCDITKANPNLSISLVDDQPAAIIVYTFMTADKPDCLFQVYYPTGKDQYKWTLVDYRKLGATPEPSWHDLSGESLSGIREYANLHYDTDDFKLSKPREELMSLYYHEISVADFANMYMYLITAQ